MQLVRRNALQTPNAGRTHNALLVLIVLLSIMGSVVVIGAGAAAAHGFDANGCTGVPDSGYGYEFHAPCDSHDRCYRRQPYGSGYGGRRLCDRIFRSEMLHYCERHARFSLKRASCRSTATAFYYGVRALGYPFWNRQLPSMIG